MSGNGYGTYMTSRAEAMATYDAAPPELRYLMRNAVAKWATAPLVEEYRAAQFATSPKRALQLIRDMINRNERQDTLADYGPHHPEAARA